jgi:hypothetical protein
MVESKREAVMSALSALYNAVPGQFGLLSVPADRPPHEHLAQIEERLDGSRARAPRVFWVSDTVLEFPGDVWDGPAGP